MKKLVLIIALVARVLTASAQDTIYLKNGEVRCAWIIEESNTTVKFKYCQQPNGLVRTITNEEIWKIRYGNTEITKYYSYNTPSAPLREGKSSYAGPRFGATYIGPGAIADKMYSDNKTPVITQFGWQFETRFFKTAGGVSGLFEFVPMIGGMEQGLFLPSASFLMGIRIEKGDIIEFGIGPNLSQSGLGMLMAAGTSFHIGEVYFPVTVSLLPSIGKTESITTPKGDIMKIKYETGVRLSITVGFNLKKS